jgi:hypothetical protein
MSNGNSFTCILPASHCQSKPVLGCGTVSPAVITGICCETKPVLGSGTVSPAVITGICCETKPVHGGQPVAYNRIRRSISVYNVVYTDGRETS